MLDEILASRLPSLQVPHLDQMQSTPEGVVNKRPSLGDTIQIELRGTEAAESDEGLREVSLGGKEEEKTESNQEHAARETPSPEKSVRFDKVASS
jgi:hypothetical protein